MYRNRIVILILTLTLVTCICGCVQNSQSPTNQVTTPITSTLAPAAASVSTPSSTLICPDLSFSALAVENAIGYSEDPINMMWIVPPASFPQTTNKPNNPRDVLVNAIVTEWEETGWSLEVSKGEVGTVITACQNDVCCAARLQECGVEPKPDACVDTRAGVGSVYVHVWKIQ